VNRDKISLEAAIAMTGVSKRTLWRRVSSGSIKKIGKDSRGRAMLCLADVSASIPISMSKEDREILLKADSGEAEAQNDAGAMFYIVRCFDAAAYWFIQAATQQNPDAMQWLGQCHASGHGVSQDSNLAIMWLAKSAALGNFIARQQIQFMIEKATTSDFLERFDPNRRA
jgi:TPR repeat protein